MPAPEAHGVQVEAARRGHRWTDAAGHTVVEPVVPPAALTTIVSVCLGTDAKFGPLRSRLRLLRCYGALQEIAFAGVLIARNANQQSTAPCNGASALTAPASLADCSSLTCDLGSDA